MSFVSKVEEHVRTNFEPKKLQHAYAVRENALRLTEGMETDKEIIEISALLHEAGTTKMESSMKALSILSELEYNEDKKHQIAKLINNHPFDSFILEQRILFEADKFEHKEKSFSDKIKSFLGFK
ncbi:HD domain-containing protein [Candidatus Micrarchaeota archaeon]|nr:HD domain-containing protein [Candidatus Micrarchaeota archaeon]